MRLSTKHSNGTDSLNRIHTISAPPLYFFLLRNLQSKFKCHLKGLVLKRKLQENLSPPKSDLNKLLTYTRGNVRHLDVTIFRRLFIYYV